MAKRSKPVKRYRVVYTMLTKWEMVLDAESEDAAKHFNGEVISDAKLDDGTPYDTVSVEEVSE